MSDSKEQNTSRRRRRSNVRQETGGAKEASLEAVERDEIVQRVAAEVPMGEAPEPMEPEGAKKGPAGKSRSRRGTTSKPRAPRGGASATPAPAPTPAPATTPAPAPAPRPSPVASESSGGKAPSRRRSRTPKGRASAAAPAVEPPVETVAAVVKPVAARAPVVAKPVVAKPVVAKPAVKKPIVEKPIADAPNRMSLAAPAASELVTEASDETVSGIIREIPDEDMDEAEELDIDTLAELELQAAEAGAGVEVEADLPLSNDRLAPGGEATGEVATDEMPRRRRRRRGRGRRGRGGQGQPQGEPGQLQNQQGQPMQDGGTAVGEPGVVEPSGRQGQPPRPQQQPPRQPRPPQPQPRLAQPQRQQRPADRGPQQPAARPPQPQPQQGRGPQPVRPQPVSPLPVALLEEAAGVEEEEEGEEVTSDKIMLVNLAQSDECRIAMLEEGLLQEFYVERMAALSHVGNVYKGVITNIEPSIQAAFIDFGEGKNGFLHISDLQPQFFPGGGEAEDVGRKTPRKERPPIQKCLRRGQEIVVQVTKEGIGTKGATLTTYVALPGRYLVMMPGMSRLGVSRKIEDEEARRRMRDVLNQLELPEEMGFILRTAGLDRNKRDLQRDLNYLARLWKQVMKRESTIKAPAELFRESDLVTRTLRDVVTTDVKEILIDDEAVAITARQFLRLLSPRLSNRVKYYSDTQPLFFKYGVEDEIAKMYSKRVPLRSGGSLVIESTEALVAIDVNSGKFREAPDPEESAFRINLEAADEIARQLSLRDLGGVIICDFIDMHMERHRREIERALREALKKHKERAEILRMSRFGIIEMTRQRQRASIVRSMLVDCPHCGGGGLIKSVETLMLETLRAIQTAATHQDVSKIEVRVNPQVAQMLLNSKRQILAEIESKSNRTIVVIPTAEVAANKITVTCVDTRGWAVQVPLPKSLLNGSGSA